MLFAAHHLHRDTRFSYRALARQSRDPQHCDKVIGSNAGFYASDITNLLHPKISGSVAHWYRSRLHVQINQALFFFDIVIFFLFIFYFLILFFSFACFPLFLLLTLNGLVKFCDNVFLITLVSCVVICGLLRCLILAF